MSEMIERVARAMAEKAGYVWEHMVYDPDMASCPDESKMYWLDTARAAMEAMREPTGGMITAAVVKAKEEQLRPIDLHRKDADDLWQAMIEAALK